MKKRLFICMALAASFALGFAFNSLTASKTEAVPEMKKVTSIGGIFFKCKDPKQMREWYKTHLGLNTNAYGAVFEWWQGADSTKKGFTQWSPLKRRQNILSPLQKIL